MPLKKITVEEQKWAEKIYSHFNWSFPEDEAAQQSEALVSTSDVDIQQQLEKELTTLEETLHRLEELNALAKSHKATASGFKKAWKAAEANVNAARAALAKSNHVQAERKISALRKNVLELDHTLEKAEQALAAVTRQAQELKQKFAAASDRHAEFTKLSYVQKTYAKRFARFEATNLSIDKLLGQTDLSLSMKDIDQTAKLLKAAEKKIPKLEKEVRGFDQQLAENTKPKVTVAQAELVDKLEQDYIQKEKVRAPQVCYHAALKVGILEGNLPEFLQQALMEKKTTKGYPVGYAALMGISPETLEKNFSSNEISESSIINFWDDELEKVSHTAYLQKTDVDTVELYHTNCLPLDKALLGDTLDIPLVGSMTHYNLSEEATQDWFQQWLNSGYSFKVTPTSEFNK